MLRDEAVVRIQDGLGFRTDLTDKIILRLQEEQRMLEMGTTLPWFLIEEDAPIALTTGVNVVDLPTGFLRPLDYEPMQYRVDDRPTLRYIIRKNFDKMVSAYSDADPAGPEVFALRGSTIYLLPVPNQDYSVTWSYYKKAQVLTTNVENSWLREAPEVLIGGAGVRMARDTRDKDALSIFTSMYNDAKLSLFREIVAREEAAARRRKGSGL